MWLFKLPQNKNAQIIFNISEIFLGKQDLMYNIGWNNKKKLHNNFKNNQHKTSNIQ